MKVLVEGVEIILNDALCNEYREKLLYEITPDECKVYAESYFDMPFADIVKTYPMSGVVAAIEGAMKEEITL